MLPGQGCLGSCPSPHPPACHCVTFTTGSLSPPQPLTRALSQLPALIASWSNPIVFFGLLSGHYLPGHFLRPFKKKKNGCDRLGTVVEVVLDACSGQMDGHKLQL